MCIQYAENWKQIDLEKKQDGQHLSHEVFMTLDTQHFSGEPWMYYKPTEVTPTCVAYKELLNI